MADAWSSWALPSAADLIFVAILCSLVFTPLSVKLLGDAGIGWHIRTGKLILSTRSIPRVDPFSTQIGKPWIAWEWLYDVIVGGLQKHAGLNGVVWFTAVVIAAVFAATFRLLMRRGANFFFALGLTLLAMTAAMIHFLARPHVLSWLFALLWFWILSSNESGMGKIHRHSLWFLAPLMLVWANVHGGFVLGFVLLGIFWIGSFWTWIHLKESRLEESLEKIAAGKRVRDLILVGGASAAASLVNPYGWYLHVHIYRYLTNRFFMDHIEEFQSPNFHGLAQRCFLVLLLIAIAALAVRSRKLNASEILLVLFAVYAGLYASRNIPIAAILLALVIETRIASFGFTAFVRRMSAVDSTLRGHVWPIFAGLATLTIALNGGRVGSTQMMDAHFDPQRMPVAALDFIEHAAIKEPVFSPDYWGGYAIFRLYPRERAVIDDRHDFYGEEWLKRYLSTLHVEPDWRRFLSARWCIVLPTHAALTQTIRETTEWKAVYSDDVATVFTVRRVPPDSDKSSSD